MKQLRLMILSALTFGLSWLLLPGTLACAESGLEKSDLFKSGRGGYAAYRIPGIVATSQGSLLAYCEARRTSRSDWDEIDILLLRSTDGGKSWSEPQKLSDVPGPKAKNPAALAHAHVNPNHVTYNNPVAIAARDGAVHFLFCLEYARCFYRRSEDDGQSWSPAVEITDCFDRFREAYPWRVVATGPGHGIELTAGRLLVPVWLSTGTGGHAHRPSVTSVIYSDDQGHTWHTGEIAIPHAGEFIHPNEASVAQLPDGRVLLNARSESHAHRRIMTYSDDGGGTWTRPHFAETLLDPICMGSMVANSNGKPFLLFTNPNNLERADGRIRPGVGRDRKNLTVRVSYDGGMSWPVSRTLEAGSSAYSDLAVLPDGTIVCLYERGSTPAGGSTKSIDYAFLTVARFNLDWVTGGIDGARSD